MDQDLEGATYFAHSVRELLEQGSTVQVLSLFADNKNANEILRNSWDLIPIVAKHLSAESERNTPEVFKCCEKLIDILAEQSKPGEALLQFIEEIESVCDDDTKFLMLVKPLRKVLFRVPEKRVTSLAWCFNSIQSYLNKLETPEDQNLDDEEKLLLECSPLVQRISFIYAELSHFCQDFINELLNLNLDECGSERVFVIRKGLVQLLGKPLALLHMDSYKNSKPEARRAAEGLVENILSVTPDPFIFLDMQSDMNNADLMKPNDLSLGVFYYLLIYENIGSSCTPKVYSPVYILHNVLRLIVQLLSEENEFAITKGLHLTQGVFRSISNGELSYLLLHSEEHSRFCRTLSHIIVFNSSRQIRKTGLDVFKQYLWAFEHKGRYFIIYNMMNCVTHSGLKGFIITQYKEMLRHQLENLQNNETLNEYYRGHKLFNLLQKFTFLKNKEETDLVDESDQIVSTLNLVRYLVLADKNGSTEIHKYLQSLDDSYFKHLRQGIRMARAHYELKVKEYSQNKDSHQEKNGIEFSVNVSGKELLQVPTQQRIDIMNMSLTTLDVIASLLSRVVSCIEDQVSKCL